jgi:hypothetical protein
MNYYDLDVVLGIIHNDDKKPEQPQQIYERLIEAKTFKIERFGGGGSVKPLAQMLNRLVKDNYAEVHLSSTPFMINSNSYQITYDGVVFIEDGGYQQAAEYRAEENQRKEDFENLQVKLNESLIKSTVSNRWTNGIMIVATAVIATSAVLALIPATQEIKGTVDVNKPIDVIIYDTVKVVLDKPVESEEDSSTTKPQEPKV